MVAAQVDYESEIYRIVIYDKNDEKITKEVILKEGNFFSVPCGSVCEGPSVYYNEISQELHLAISPENYYDYTPETLELQRYIYSLKGELLRKGEKFLYEKRFKLRSDI